ncbi:shikimate kinase [Thermodesulfovibrio hydrogeniphilus]
MGSGKTTVGKMIAKKLGLSFVDLDDVIEQTTGMKISDIFKNFGENRFRDIESEIVKIVSKKSGLVIATGGGVVLRQENIENLKNSGIVFWLTASEDTIYERVKSSKDRPLLQVENPKERIKQLMQKRKPLYEKADVIIDTEGLTIEKVAEKIISEYERLVDGKD